METNSTVDAVELGRREISVPIGIDIAARGVELPPALEPCAKNHPYSGLNHARFGESASGQVVARFVRSWPVRVRSLTECHLRDRSFLTTH